MTPEELKRIQNKIEISPRVAGFQHLVLCDIADIKSLLAYIYELKNELSIFHKEKQQLIDEAKILKAWCRGETAKIREEEKKKT